MKKFILCLAFVGLASFTVPQTAEAAMLSDIQVTYSKGKGTITTAYKDCKGRTHLMVMDKDGRILYED